MKILIATGMRPTVENADKVFNMMRESAAEGKLTIPAFYWTKGPGCTNLAFEIVGPDDEAEKFANALTMALMPAKWCLTDDPIPATDTVTL